MRKIVVTIMLCLSLSPLHAQMDEWGGEKIDSAYMVCQYKYKSPRLDNGVSIDDMRLEVGRKSSKFYSYITLAFDSLISTPGGKMQVRKMKQELLSKLNPTSTREDTRKAFEQMPSIRSTFVVYTNYPKGKMTVQDKIGNEDCKYEEEMLPQEWIIQDDTMSVLGYSCQKAICTWRGRDYIAWFAADIPFSGGPMKFNGLPGLIMKVEDTQQKYTFEIKGIQKTTDRPIYLSKPRISKEFQAVTRTEFNKRTIRATKNMIRSLTNPNVVKATSSIDEKKVELMELE